MQEKGPFDTRDEAEKTRSNLVEMGHGKGLDIRKKYRKGKGLRRRIKRSQAGASTMYVSEKDLKACKESCSQKGVKLEHLGSN